MPFAVTHHEYLAILASVRSVFDTQARFPENVLRRPARTLYFEFEELFDVPLWRSLELLARQSGETETLGLILDPTPQYFRDHFDYYGAMRLPVDGMDKEALALLVREPDGSAADAVTHNGRVLAFVTRSLGVALWAERELGIGLVAVRNADLATALTGSKNAIRWFDAREVLSLITPTFVGNSVPDQFRAEFLSNYGVQPT